MPGKTIAGKTALIIGASRGIGLGLVQEFAARGWQVTGTKRGPAPDLDKVPGAAVETVDVNFPDEIAALRRRLEGQRFDLLFVNAGMMNNRADTSGTVSTDEFNRVMNTNTLGPMRAVEALGDLVDPRGTIAVMTSVLGSNAANTGGTEIYRASKAALNSLLKSFAARAKKTQTFLAVHPGWVLTEIGGPNAMLDVATSVRGIADVVEARAGKTGVSFLDYSGKEIPW